MFDVLTISIPFFAIIALGAGARRFGLFDEASAVTISKFAFFIALPCYLFHSIARNDPADFINFGFILRYEAATIIIFALSAFIARRRFGLSHRMSGIFGLNTAYPNYGYMGLPLVILAFGDAAALPMGLILLADTVVLLGMTAFYVSAKGGTIAAAAASIALTMVKNPLLLSVVAGLGFAASGATMPLVLDHFVTILAGAAAPAALVALGATLYGQSVRDAYHEVSAVTFAKLIIHPALVAALFLLLPGQEAIWIKVAVIAASLPVAANVFMLAQVYNSYIQRSASAILVTTLVATFTVPITLYLVFRFV